MGNLEFYNSEDYQEMGKWELIPEGVYRAIIAESSLEKTQAGDGEFLKITWQILDGDFEDAKIIERLNLKNKNEKAVAIAGRIMKSICIAIGNLHPKDSSELHDVPIMITVAISENKKYGTNENKIKKYEPIEPIASNITASKPSPKKEAPVQNSLWKRK